MRNIKATAYDPTSNDFPFWQNGIYYTYWLNVRTHMLYKWSKTGWKIKEINYGQETINSTRGKA